MTEKWHDPQNDEDDPVAQCMSCEWHYPKLDLCTNDEITEIKFPCPGYKAANNPGFVIKDSDADKILHGERKKLATEAKMRALNKAIKKKGG